MDGVIPNGSQGDISTIPQITLSTPYNPTNLGDVYYPNPLVPRETFDPVREKVTGSTNVFYITKTEFPNT